MDPESRYSTTAKARARARGEFFGAYWFLDYGTSAYILPAFCEPRIMQRAYVVCA